MPGTSYLQGDIILVPFPFSDLTSTKVRPAVIISNSTVNKTSDVICAQLTSQIYRDDFSFEIERTDVTNPFDRYSEVRCHKLFTVDKSIIQKKISRIHSPKQLQLLDKIKSLL